MLSKALVVGAYQRKLEEIARHPGVELVAVVPPSWRDAGHETRLERLHQSGYALVESPIAVNGNFHLFFFPELGHLLDEHRPDVVHVDEEPYNFATFLAVWYAQRRGIPTLFFTWQNLLRRYPEPFSWMERYVYGSTVAAIAGTASAADVLRAKGYRGTIAVIPQFGPDPDVFRPSDTRSPQPFTIGFAGRLVPEKGVPLLLEAFTDLGDDARLVILGTGPEGPALQERVAALGLGDRVRLEGAVPSGRIPAYLQQLDVVVLPSLSRPNWIEQFGRILVEAMACEVPVVGSTCGEIPGVIADAGLTFPEGDVPALTAALERLAREPALRADLGRRGRQRVLDHYTPARIAAQTVDLYQRVARTHARHAVSEGR
jgi:glycosyltransferase involved in cell wall biosynthesis